MLKGGTDYCRKDPENHGISCAERDEAMCEKCGWNPSVYANRVRERNEVTRLGVKHRCLRCVHLGFCANMNCSKDNCGYFSEGVSDADDILHDIRLETAERGN